VDTIDTGYEMLIETQLNDLGYRGFKELNAIEVSHEHIESLKLTTVYQPENSKQVIEVGPVYGAPDGTFFPNAAGNDLAFRLEGNSTVESVFNGNFSSAPATTGWTTGTGWSITSNRANHTGSDVAKLTQVASSLAKTLVKGARYLVEYDLSISGGAVRVLVGGTYGISRSVSGRHQEYIIAGSDGLVEFLPSGTAGLFTGYVDNISVLLVEAKLNRMDVRFDYADDRSAFSGRIKELQG
jgi:hypothetical protein